MSDRKTTIVNVHTGDHKDRGLLEALLDRYLVLRSARHEEGLVHQKSTAVAFVLCFLFGPLGAHRFYLNRPYAEVMLILWILSVVLRFILGGVGTLVWIGLLMWALVDAFSIRNWVGEYNTALISGGMLPVAADVQRPKDLSIRLLEEARKRRGRLTVTQGVMATGESFAKVEKCLRGMVGSGYVDVDNEPGSGVVVYVFGELT